MSLPTQPFVSKSADEILGELLEQIVLGIVPMYNEEYTFSSGTDTYTLLCGSPDITDGRLISIGRVWGTKDGSYFEFAQNTDFDVDLSTNEITFTTSPDDDTTFAVTYRYDQQIVSNITDISTGSVTRVLMQSAARQFGAAWRSLELVKASAYIDTAVGDDLNELVKLVGIERTSATPSSGYVSFYRTNTSGETSISSGAQVGAPTTASDIVFATQSTGTFYDGFSSVRVPVEADAAYVGLGSNVAPNRITKILSDMPASKCNNPAYYTDYEFIILTEGNYAYVLDHSPRRVVNSNTGTGPPWLEDDKGMVGILGFRDASMLTASWATTNVAITADDPETGQLKCVPSTSVDAEIATAFSVNHNTYTHVFAMLRGTVDDVFGMKIDGNSVSMYEFGSTSSSTAPTVNTNWTLYCGKITSILIQDDGINQQTSPPASTSVGDRYIVEGPAGGDWSSNTDDVAEWTSGAAWSYASPATDWSMYLSTPDKVMYWNGSTWGNYATFKVTFGATHTYWVDFVGVGAVSVETSILTNADQVYINYTARSLNIWYSSVTENFYQKYDGDDSDGATDYCFIYYQWDNHVSGGGDEESDDLLRLRAREALTVAAKGTKEAIQNAVLAIEGISQCEVSDYNDDPTIDPGVFHVYVLAQGYTLSPSLNQEIVDVVDDIRAAGTHAKIFAPQVRYGNFVLNVVYDDAITDYVGTEGRQALEAVIASALIDFFSQTKINEALYFSDLYGFLIEEIRGVVAAYVDWDDATTPQYSDDDYESGYTHSTSVMLTGPQRITGYKADATVVVQGGNTVTINLLRKSEKR